MRIAQLAPLWELVPPTTYGGTELVVHNLTEELTRQGHEVTLFAAGGSKTSARLVACSPMALRAMEEQIRMDKTHFTVLGYETKLLQTVFEQADQFDVIHNHLGFQALPYANMIRTPVVTTLHNALNPPVVKEIYYHNRHLPYISISDYQQKLWPGLHYSGTIYHGLRMDRFTPCFEAENKKYLAFFGRLSPEKGPHHAIRIAKALNMPLVMAGKIDRVDKIFYDKEIAGHVDGKQVSYIGELNHEQKVRFLRNAAATLCPVTWPEPFGLVMIESMACGTPVFALRDGSTPEVIDQGKTGYVADTVDELLDAVRDYRQYDRQRVRSIAEKRFSVQRMVEDHLRVYKQLAGRKSEAESLSLLMPTLLTPARIADIKKAADLAGIQAPSQELTNGL